MGNLKSYLSYKIGKEVFASSVNNIQSIIEYYQPASIPGTPSYMLGILNLRENILPVIDLRMLFGINYRSIGVNTSILVIEAKVKNETLLIGAVVDSVSEVFEINSDKINDPPKVGTTRKNHFISGIYHMDKKIITLIDTRKLFDNNEIYNLNEYSLVNS